MMRLAFRCVEHLTLDVILRKVAKFVLVLDVAVSVSGGIQINQIAELPVGENTFPTSKMVFYFLTKTND